MALNHFILYFSSSEYYNSINALFNASLHLKWLRIFTEEKLLNMLSPKQLLALEASNESRNTPLRLQSTKELYPLPPDDKIITFDGFKAPLLQEDSRPISLQHMDQQRDILDNQV